MSDSGPGLSLLRRTRSASVSEKWTPVVEKRERQRFAQAEGPRQEPRPAAAPSPTAVGPDAYARGERVEDVLEASSRPVRGALPEAAGRRGRGGAHLSAPPSARAPAGRGRSPCGRVPLVPDTGGVSARVRPPAGVLVQGVVGARSVGVVRRPRQSRASCPLLRGPHPPAKGAPCARHHPATLLSSPFPSMNPHQGRA